MQNRFVSALAILGIFLGAADPLLAEPIAFESLNLPTGPGPTFVLATNFIANGRPDLVTPNFGFRYGCIGDYGSDGSNLTYWVNNGQAVFPSHSTLAIVPDYGSGPTQAPDPACVAAADFNGTGHLDLIVPDFYYNVYTILTNNGKGVLKAGGAGGPAGGRGPLFVAIADVNRDGKPDYISVNNFDSDIAVITNGGGYTFSNSAILHGGAGPCWVAAADLTGNGIIDLVSANYGTNCGDGNTLTVFMGDGHGGFTTNATLTVGYGPACVIAADVNGDGKIDLITANQIDSTLTILTNDGLGNFSLKATLGVYSPSSVVAADINGDGKIDLVCANSDNGFRGSVTVLTNDGLGNFSTNTVVPVGNASDDNYPDSITAADLLGNGKMDLIVGNYGTASMTVLLQTSAKQPVEAMPVVDLTSPTNGAAFLTNQTITVKATTRSAVSGLALYVDGQLLEETVITPYTLQIPAGSLAPGGHTLQVVATTSGGLTGSSAVNYITVNSPGTALIDFDALNTSAGDVGGTVLAKYLAWYGVTLEDVTVGATMEAVDTNTLTGSIQAEVPSAPNFFTEAGLTGPVSFTLRFANPLQSFGFTRVGLSSSSGWVSHPQWTATAFDSNGVELSSITQPLILTQNSVPEQSYVLPGNGIASVRFDSDSQQIAAFSGVLLDNLILSTNPVPSTLSVALSVTSPATNNIVAPATITLSAAVTSDVNASVYVSFFAGAALLDTVSNAPFEFTWTNVLPGNYSLAARAVNSFGLGVPSSAVPITVQLEPNSELVNFDLLNATRGPVEGAALKDYLAGFRVTITNLTPGTELAVESQQRIAGGNVVVAASPPNVLTQTGSSGPAQFTLEFDSLLTQFGFTRPELLANPFVSFPGWQATAFDGSGAVLSQVTEPEIDSSTNVAAQEFSLGTLGGPGIAKVEFSSQGSGLAAINAMVADNLILTTNQSAFPPAVSITQPTAGQALASPPALTIIASASDPKGIASVSFYATLRARILLGTATSSPYSVTWTNPPIGAYGLTAIASNNVGLTSKSSPVFIEIEPPATQFGIVSQPASQAVSLGGSVTFSVVTTGTNGVTYQWFHNTNAISGATSSTLVVVPPIADSDAGTYTVTATSEGTNLASEPATLTVVNPPVFTVQPPGQTGAPGASLTLSPEVSGSGPFVWQWLLNGSRIPGATNRVYSIPDAQPLRSGNYQVTVANSAASAASSNAPVLVQTSVTIPETNDTFATRAGINPLLGAIADSNVLATAQAGAPLPEDLPGGNSIWFTWQPAFTGTVSLTTLGSDFDTVLAVYTGTNLSRLKAVAADDDSGGFKTSLVTFNVTAGTHYQIAVDGFQGASGRVVLGLPAGTGYRVLNPSTGDSVPVIVRGPANQVVAPNARAVLSVQGRSTTKLTYQWYFQGAPVAGGTHSSLAIAHVLPGSVGSYYVLVANAAGSVQSEPATVQFAVNEGGKNISTENKFINSAGAPSPSTLAYDITPMDAGGDTRGFSLSQTFSTVGASLEPGEPEPCGQVGGASQWFVYTAPETGIMQINTDGSAFNTLLGVYTGTGSSFASLTEEGCGYTTNYLTEPQPSVLLTGVQKGKTFYIQVDGFQGASGVAQLHVGLGQPLSFHTLPESQSVTAGENATFTATAGGSAPAFYQWQLNGVNLPGATKPSWKVIRAQQEAAGNYTLIASNALGVVTSSPPAGLTVQFAPFIVSGPSNQTVTAGHSAKFTVKAVGVNVRTDPFVYQWYFNGGALPKDNHVILSIPAARATNAGSYSIVISNSYGTATSAVATLTVVGTTALPRLAKAAANNSTSVSAGRKSLPDSAANSLSAAAGTYGGLFYPANGATLASSGFFTATVAGGANGTYSANILLDGGRYAFAGQFDSSGDTEVIVPRTGQTSLAVSLHLDLSAAAAITGVISNSQWCSVLQADRVVLDSATNGGGELDGRFALIMPPNTLVGYLTITNTPSGTALVAGTLAETGLVRSAPMVKGAAIPLYIPLYSGQGLFLGWITLTNSTLGGSFGSATWVKPGSPPATVLIVK